METLTLLGLPREILKMILEHCFTDLEVMVRYFSQRTDDEWEFPAVLSILLVCKLIHNLAKPVFFRTTTFGHRKIKYRKYKMFPPPKVPLRTSVPVDEFMHLCVDIEYARQLTTSDPNWPWPKIKSLKLVEDHGPVKRIWSESAQHERDCTSGPELERYLIRPFLTVF